MPATNGVIEVVRVEVDERGPERDAEVDRRVQRGDVEQDQDLDQHRRAAEEPDVDPARAAQHQGSCDRRISARITPSTIPIAIARTVSSSVSTQPVEDPAVEQVVADDAPLEAVVGRPTERIRAATRSSDDPGRDPAAGVADRNRLDLVGRLRSCHALRRAPGVAATGFRYWPARSSG